MFSGQAHVAQISGSFIATDGGKGKMDLCPGWGEEKPRWTEVDGEWIQQKGWEWLGLMGIRGILMGIRGILMARTVIQRFANLKAALREKKK